MEMDVCGINEIDINRKGDSRLPAIFEAGIAPTAAEYTGLHSQ